MSAGGMTVGGPGPRGAILVVEDDADIRSLLSTVLTGAGFAVNTVASGEAAVELMRREQPVLVLLDIRLPGLSGYEVCRWLRERFRDVVPIVFMSAERKESFDRAAGLMLGADDYLMKPFLNEELLARIRGLLRRTVPTPRLLAENLTARELEVLRLLAGGLTQADIANQLLISGKTVGTHIEHILMKLDVPSRAQAVAVAYRENLVEPNGAAPVGPWSTRRVPPTFGSTAVPPATLRLSGQTKSARSG
ncbi:MAG: response regulator transcription factor [Chloroflexi bacterium]|nr:MAG: response regulator transcription factor [Chloroflexota bacterium]